MPVILTRFIFVFIFCFSGLTFAADDYARITFVRGKPQINIGDKRLVARIGRRVPLNARISIPKRSQLTLLYNGMQLKLRSGDVVLKEALSKNNAQMAQEASFISHMIRPPYSAPAKVMPTKVAGIRGKAVAPAAKTNTGQSKTTTGGSPYRQHYALLGQGQFDALLQKLKRPVKAEEYYLLGLAEHGKGKTAMAKRTLFKAAKKSGNDGKMRIKVETALASMYMQEGRYKRALQRLNYAEKKVEAKYHNPELYFLLYKNNDLVANHEKARAYQQTLQKKYPGHKLTSLANPAEQVIVPGKDQ